MEKLHNFNRLLIISILAAACSCKSPSKLIAVDTIEQTREYIGMWVTKDGYIRHELLAGNRYDEARGNRKSAYQGSYKIAGNHIDYKDDTGFTADGEFIDGVLHHAGMVLYKEN